MTRSRNALLSTLALLLVAGSLSAQQPEWDPNRVDMTREELEQLLSSLEAVVQSQAYSEQLRGEARREAEAARARLAQGDFRSGDRIVLNVRDEAELSDTFTVSPGLTLELPLVGAMSLRGILFAELEGRLTQHIARLIRVPVVRARPMIRLTILGEIGRPGFYTFPVELPLADVLMRVGGPTANADLDRAVIARQGDELWEGDRLEVALGQGRTLQDLRLRTGDRVFIGSRAEENLIERVGGYFLAAIPGSLIVSALFGGI